MYCNWLYSPDWTHINYDRYMIVHMTRLYTKLVTYARLHILILVVSFYHDISYISFIPLFLILIILFFLFQLSCCYCLYCYYVRVHFPLQIHSLGRFWWPWIHTSRYWMFHVIDQVFDEIVRFARSWNLSLVVLVFLSLLSSCHFLILDIYQIQSLFQFFLYDIMRGCFYVILQWSLIYYSLDL